jgi:hypothetical protein
MELRQRLRVGDDLLSTVRRSRELANWLQHLVVPAAARDLVHMRGPRLQASVPPVGTASFSILKQSSSTSTGGASTATPDDVAVVDNPFTGEVVASVPLLKGADSVAQTIRAAQTQRQWAAETTVEDRVAMVGRFLDALDADAEQ